MYGTFLRLLLPLLLAVVLLADGPSLSAVALAAAALVACAVVSARAVPSVPSTRVRTALRERDRRTAFLPQRDPDAPGRRRPRAPGRRASAATAVPAS
ncbi:DUF6412 domain-containing protein [Streptomyces fradiae]|uniref:DUF6412 domain-containing protein n=1 Tax=Streptomyces fradiae TaxID=1906 RepID=UPI0029429BF6|nr:DUF6412 domain-containing protein [Streptomyces fradiae]WOI59249.1 DUF6412 domain-containing protein [Streptomyces fradiae]